MGRKKNVENKIRIVINHNGKNIFAWCVGKRIRKGISLYDILTDDHLRYENINDHSGIIFVNKQATKIALKTCV